MEPLDPELRRIIQAGLAEARPGDEVEARVLAGLLARLPPEGGPGGDSNGGPGPGGEVAVAAKAAGGVKALVIGGVLAVGVVVAAAATRERAAAPRAARASGHVVKDRSEGGAAAVAVTTAPAEEVAGPRGTGGRAGGERTAGGAVDQGGEARGGVARGVEVERRGAEEGRGEVPARGSEADALLAESRGVAEAEEALGRGDFAGALARVRALEGSHPGGQLRLEREAVEICARCGLQEDGAGESAREFLRVHAGAAVAGKVRARCAEVLRRNSPGP